MKVFVTRYALTTGIEETDGEYGDQLSDWIVVKNKHGWPYSLGPVDWYASRDAAIVRAEEMRLAKIASLQKQVAKLEKLKFT